jgi:hypothetical protein
MAEQQSPFAIQRVEHLRFIRYTSEGVPFQEDGLSESSPSGDKPNHPLEFC